jgi:hypothetical protein
MFPSEIQEHNHNNMLIIVYYYVVSQLTHDCNYI